MEQTIAFPANDESARELDTKALHPFSLFNSESKRMPEAAIIVAMARDRAIGRRGDMPWHIPADLKHFKKLTLGHPVIMGRKTFLSLPGGALPGRRNIVVTSSADFKPEGVEIASSPEEALALCAGEKMPFVIGGGKIYEAMLPYVNHLYITEIETEVPDADTHFPPFDPQQWIEDAAFASCGEHNGLKFRFTHLSRRSLL